MKVDKKEHLKLMILNMAIIFLNSVSKVPLLGKFGPETSKYFV